MREQVAEGGLLIVIGMAVVMTALVILMVAIMVMTRLFPGKDVTGEEKMTKVKQGDEPTKESIAALAVAMALAMKQQEAGNISGNEESSVSGPVGSRWSAAGKERLMASRRRKQQKWGKPSR